MCPVPLRKQLTDFLVPLPSIEEAGARKSVVNAAGFSHLVGQIDWGHSARVFVDGDEGLLDAFSTEGHDQLAAFLSKLLDNGVLLPPGLGLDDVPKLQDLIARVQALSDQEWAEQFPYSDQTRRERAAQSITPDGVDIRTALQKGRAVRQASADVGTPPELVTIDDDAIWGYDLIQQETSFKTSFVTMPRYGVFRYNACDKSQLLETYVVARMEHCLQEDLKRTLSADNKARIVLTEAELADDGQALTAVNRALAASGYKSLGSYVSKKGPDSFLTIVNWNPQSPQVGPFMTSLAQQVETQLGPKVQRNNLYLIILWIDKDLGPPQPRPQFWSVPQVGIFMDKDSVMGWLEQALDKARVTGGRRKVALVRLGNRLSSPSPSPWDVYEALRSTVEDLKGGRI